MLITPVHSSRIGDCTCCISVNISPSYAAVCNPMSVSRLRKFTLSRHRSQTPRPCCCGRKLVPVILRAQTSSLDIQKLFSIHFFKACSGYCAWTASNSCLQSGFYAELTFKNLASHIQDGRKITFQIPHFIFIQEISVLNILNMLHNLHFFLFKMPFIS